MKDNFLKRLMTRTGLAANIIKTQITRKIITSDADKEKHWLQGVTDPKKIAKIKERIKRDHGNSAILKAKPLDMPDHLILYVTGKCGARCGFCYYGKELNQKDNVTGLFHELSLDRIEKLSKEFGKLNQVALTGGDPFLRIDLAKIAQIFWKNNRPEAIHIPTNGLPIELVKKTTMEILETVPTDLTIAMSIDAVGQLYDEVRGVKGNFVSMMKMYDMLAELKKKYTPEAMGFFRRIFYSMFSSFQKKKGKLHLVVNSVITNYTLPDAPNLIKHVRERLPLVDLHDFDFVRGDPYDNSFMLPTFNDLLNFRKLIFENFEHYYKSKVGLALKKYQYDLNLETIQKKTQVLPCVAGETFVVIKETGGVYFCELREPIGDLVLCKNCGHSELRHGFQGMKCVKEGPGWRDLSKTPEERKELAEILKHIPSGWNTECDCSGFVPVETLTEIWKGKRGNDLRESIHKKECFCTHGCFQPLAILYNQGAWFKTLKYTGYLKHKLPEPDVHRVEEKAAASTKFEGQINIGDSVPVQMPGEGGGLLWGEEAIHQKET